jgi:outer membrane lipoprotein-sorting protein
MIAGGIFGIIVLGAAPADLPGEQILKNIEAGRAAVKDYTVTLDIVADVERVNVPPMKAKMYFKYPDKVHFDSKGFALLPREGLALNPETLTRLYTVNRVSRDTLEGTPEYTLELRAKSEKTRIQRLVLSVNPARWTIDRVQIRRGGERLITMQFSHASTDGHWLPAEAVASFSVASDTTEAGTLDPTAPMRPPQMPRTGKISIHFSNYQINTGLSDSLFVSGMN